MREPNRREPVMDNQTQLHESAAALAARLRQSDSSVQVMASHIQRIHEINPRLNALIVPLFDQARAAALAADQARSRGESLGPLHGVPITIKESFDIVGTPTTTGLANRQSMLATKDSPLVARLKGAGAVVLGKTNVPQLLIYHESDSPVYGRANNPWDQSRTPGGSSGGEAAIIAAGGSLLGIGSDIGGSIRVPAHFCGIAGLKPTAGRFSVMGSADEWLLKGQEIIAAQPGPMARSVEDLTLAMQILLGEAPTAPTIAPVPLGDPRTIDIKRLRIGFYTDDAFFPASPAIRRAVREAAQALRAAGAYVVEFTPPDVACAMQLFFRILAADAGRGAQKLLAGNPVDRRVKGLTQTAAISRPVRAVIRSLLLAAGQKRLATTLRDARGVTTPEYFQAVAARTEYQGKFYAALDALGIDAIVCPPHALPAMTHGSGYYLLTAASYAMLYNVLGMPAGVVPATRVRAGEESDRPKSRDIVEKTAREVEADSVGLPVGVQVAGRHWREDVVLSVMSVLEQHFRQQPDYPVRPLS